MSSGLRGADAALRRQVMARWVAAYAVGAALNLAFAPFGYWPIGFVTLAVLFALIRGLPPKRAGAVGAAFGAGLSSVGTYWIYTCLHVYGLVPLWLTLIMQAVLVAAMSVYTASLCYLANRFWLKSGWTRDWLVLPALWLLLEWLRGWFLTGFPWLSLGYAYVGSPLQGWAPLFGVYGVSFAVTLIAMGVNVLCTPGGTLGRRSFAAVLIVVMFVVPYVATLHRWTTAAGAALPIAAVQGAVSQDQKWQGKNRDKTMDRYTDLTLRAWGARLIVWPEAAIPVLADELTEYLDSLKAAGEAHHADFAIGLVNYEADTDRFFNGLLVLSAAGDGWYYKRHLVPFGEYFPVPPFIRSWMRLLSLPYDDITPGGDHQPTLQAAGQKLGLTICYEDAFGSAQLAVLREATLLINVTNNAWYGDSTAPHQHLQISRMRALEADRYLVRAANDGITAVIGPDGRIVARLPQFQEGVLKAEIVPLSGLTPYARWGNYPVVGSALLCLACAAWRRRRGA